MHGYTTAFGWAAAILVLAASIVTLSIRAGGRQTGATQSNTDQTPEPVLTH